MELHFNITNDHIKLMSLSDYPVSDSINHLKAVFEFDEAWDGFTKTALFSNGSGSRCVLLENDECVIPWETLTGKHVYISVYGVKDDVRITATEVKIPLAPSGYTEGKTPEPPTPTVYEQLLELLGDRSITTEKLADGAVTYDKLDTTLQEFLDYGGKMILILEDDLTNEHNRINDHKAEIDAKISHEVGLREEADLELQSQIMGEVDALESSLLETQQYIGNKENLVVDGTLTQVVSDTHSMAKSNYGLANHALELIGDTEELETSDKSSLVNAINELEETLSVESLARNDNDQILADNIEELRYEVHGLQSFLEWKPICNAEITEADIADGEYPTAITIDLGAPITEWYGETMLEIYVPQSDDINTGTDTHTISVAFGVNKSASLNIGSTSNNVCRVFASSGEPSFKPKYNNNIIMFSQWKDKKYCISTEANIMGSSISGLPTTSYATSLYWINDIANKKYFSVYGRNQTFKFPAGTKIALYGRF